MNYDSVCSRHLRCSANICPLDPDISLRSYIQGDGLCVHILNYLEGKDTPFDNEIVQTEKVWRNKIPDSVFKKRLKARVQVREHFQKDEKKKVSTEKGIHNERLAI